MSVSVWHQAPAQEAHYECDIAVVGAGIVGAYTAFTLASRGKKVALLENRFPAAGATGRNAGMCLTGAADNYATGVNRYGREKARALWLYTLENQQIMRFLVERFKVPAVFCGSAILGIDRRESELLLQAYELMREDGFGVEFSPEDPFERGFGSAILQPRDFGLNPAALVNALIENGGERVRLFAPAEVFAINRGPGGKLQVEARGVKVVCDQVALCTNAYSPLVSPYFAGKIAPTRAQMFLTTPLNRRIMDKLAYANYGYEYFRQLEDTSFLLGGGRSQHKELEVGYDEAATAWLQATLEEFLQKFFPEVARETRIIRRWAGIMGFTPDGLPLVGRLPEIPGDFPPIQKPFVPATPFPGQVEPSPPPEAGDSQVFFAAGFNGHGLGWGVISAEAMVGMLLGQKQNGGQFDARRPFN